MHNTTYILFLCLFLFMKALLLNVFEYDWTCKRATYLSIDITHVLNAQDFLV